jgi:hypothetical protein
MHVRNLRSLTVSERGAFVNGVIELKRRGLEWQGLAVSPVAD